MNLSYHNPAAALVQTTEYLLSFLSYTGFLNSFAYVHGGLTKLSLSDTWGLPANFDYKQSKEYFLDKSTAHWFAREERAERNQITRDGCRSHASGQQQHDDDRSQLFDCFAYVTDIENMMSQTDKTSISADYKCFGNSKITSVLTSR